MRVSRGEIARLIPHAGAMCLLDGVVAWDAQRVQAVSRTHRDPRNPLRTDGRLPAICGIEYAAQAMAVHGGLSGKVAGRPRAGYLAALRDVVCSEPWLDAHEGDLVIEAELLMGDGERVVYGFTLRAGETEILSGRATVMLDAGGERPQ